MKTETTPSWLWLLLTAAPPFAALATVLSCWTYAFHVQQKLSLGLAAWEAMYQFTDAIRHGGALAAVLYVINYVGGFGFIIVAAMLASSRWQTRQVLGFWFVSVLCILAFAAYRSLNLPMLWAHAQAGLTDYWALYRFLYPPYAIPIALFCGWVATTIPPFRSSDSAWMARGMCPRCHYDLKGRLECGCPECGWGREGSG